MQVALNGKQHYKLKAYGHEIIYFILSSTKETQMCYTENGVITTLELWKCPDQELERQIRCFPYA
jgi:hypothetical protein